MSEGYIGEIRMMANSYAPNNWSNCYGQILAINDYQAVFSLLGTAFGGDGRSSFGLPELRGRIPVGQGSGTALTPRVIGERAGRETVSLIASEMPLHVHDIQVSGNAPTSTDPSGVVTGKETLYDDFAGKIASGNFISGTIATQGSSKGHLNMMPTMCIRFVICMKGIYPTRS